MVPSTIANVLKSKAGSTKRRTIMVKRLERETLKSMDIIHSVAGRALRMSVWLWLLVRMDGCMW